MSLLPEKWIERIKLQFPLEWEELIDSLDREVQHSICINKDKWQGQINDPVPWSAHGDFLKEKKFFTLDPHFHSGSYYVQESSSMVVDFIMRKIKKYKTQAIKVLDMCAAPGGKSVNILNNLSNEDFLISNEIISKRNEILRENLTKWGNPNFLISQNKAEDFGNMGAYFDVILVDAPCSGEGMFRKDMRAREEWSEKNVKKCVKRQKNILENMLKCLSEDSFLIYSTCTLNPDENEKMIQSFIEKNDSLETMNFEEIGAFKEVEKVEFEDTIGYYFLPHKVRGEGFFLSVVYKSGKRKEVQKSPKRSKIIPEVAEYIDRDIVENYSTFKFKDSYFLAHNSLLDNLAFLQSHLFIKQLGIEVAQVKNDRITLTHGLSMMSQFHNKSLHSVHLDKNQALNFLAKKKIEKIKESEGKYLVKFENSTLGWLEVKNGQVYNLYPEKWKIRMKVDI